MLDIFERVEPLLYGIVSEASAHRAIIGRISECDIFDAVGVGSIVFGIDGGHLHKIYHSKYHCKRNGKSHTRNVERGVHAVLSGLVPRLLTSLSPVHNYFSLSLLEFL